MKIIILIFLLVFNLMADETLTQLFQQLNKTSKEQKYKVLNDIKRHIVQLKQQQRVEAIKALQKEKKLQKNLTTTCITTVPSGDKKIISSAADNSCNKEQLSQNMPMKMQSNMQNMPMMREIKDKKNMTPKEPKNPSSPQHNMPNPKR